MNNIELGAAGSDTRDVYGVHSTTQLLFSNLPWMT